jgi:uncharacterized membrane protein YkvA (DUF1232 family)
MTRKLTAIRSQIKNHISLCNALLKDKRTPMLPKVLLGPAIGYAFMPFGVIPDFIPVLGHLDDLLIVPALIYFALRFIPSELYEEHKDTIFNDRNSPDQSTLRNS